MLPMLAWSWFITKVPREQWHQVRQCHQEKVTRPQFLGFKKTCCPITLAGLDQLCELCQLCESEVLKGWHLNQVWIKCVIGSALDVVSDVRCQFTCGITKPSTGQSASRSWGMDRAMRERGGRTGPCVMIIDGNWHLWCLVFSRWVWCVIKFLILCAFWLQEPPKEVVRIIEKMGGHLRDPMKEVWEHRLPIKLSRQCLWCIQITRISFDFLWMHSWWYHHWWFVIGMLRSFEEPQGSKQKMSGLHTEVQEEVAWHQRLWGRH